MPVSEARLIANRQNASKSTGPRTPEGKEASRRNGWKHGMSGQGVVLSVDEADAVERLDQAFQAELDPKSAVGRVLVRQLAILSVKLERGAKQESAALARRVRHAAEDFVEARLDQAETLFQSIADDPRVVVRKLRRSPEGVERLLVAWNELRADLTRDIRPVWCQTHLEKMANLLGLPSSDLSGTRLAALTKAAYGFFGELPEFERAGMDDEARKAWARGLIRERVDEQIAELEDHFETLDLPAIEQDRQEACDRALFDPSREASLARRYESEARRGFFKALSELRQVEAEVAEAKAEASTPPPTAGSPLLGSSRETEGSAIREPRPSPRPVPPRKVNAPRSDWKPGSRPVSPSPATDRTSDGAG